MLVEADAIHLEDGGIWTSAGVTAGMDLALAMIEADLGRKIALAIARRHVVFRIRPGGQSQFSVELAAQWSGKPKIEKLAENIAAALSTSAGMVCSEGRWRVARDLETQGVPVVLPRNRGTGRKEGGLNSLM